MTFVSRVKKISRSIKKLAKNTVRSLKSVMSGPPRGRARVRGGRGTGPPARHMFLPKVGEDAGIPTEELDNLKLEKVPEIKEGRPVHIISNHFELHFEGRNGQLEGRNADFTVYHFHLQFTPIDLTIRQRKRILFGAREVLNGAYQYDGNEQLFCSNKFTDDSVEFAPEVGEGNQPEGGIPFLLRITFVKTLPKGDPIYLQIYNLVIRKCLLGMGLTPMGDKFCDTAAAINNPALKIQIWPGYVATTQTCEKGVLLCVDVVHKVVRETDLLTVINALKDQYQQRRLAGQMSLEKFILDDIQGAVIVTPYNNASYRIDGIKLDLNPTTPITLNKGEQITCAEYYRRKYNFTVQDLTQPLVMTKVKKKKTNIGDARETTELHLIPELCRMTGLTQEMKANFGIMKELAKHLHLEPKARIEMLQNFMERLRGIPKCQETLNSWGFRLETRVMECSMGRVLPSQSVVFGQQKQFPADEKNDWTRGLRGNKMLMSIPLMRWIVITGQRDFQKAQEFFQTMKKVASPLGFLINNPLVVEQLDDTRFPAYIRSLERILPKYAEKSLQMIFLVLPNDNANLYNSIKKRLSQDFGVVSQCILAKNLASKNAMSIATKITIQMNTKLGGEPWTIPIPPKLDENSMAIGFDYYGKGEKTGVLVATTNGVYSRYYSTLFMFKDMRDLRTKIIEPVKDCLEAYFNARAKRPQTVVFYNSCVDEGRIACGEVEKDANDLEKVIRGWNSESESSDHNEPIEVVYFVMTRRNLVRLMSHKGSCAEGVQPNQVTNPPPGTVLDSNIIAADQKYPEFFMVPTVARQGSPRAVQYKIILNQTKIPPAVLQTYTYRLCHLYFNYSGTVNLPSVCQYASKLAKHAVQTIPKAKPNRKIANLLHFL